MAIKEFIEGAWSHKWEYVEIYRDDRSCRRRFKYREEEDLAEAYYTHLQSLDNQLIAINEQKRTADETAALRKATEERNRMERERPLLPPFPQPSKQVLDPEYREWLQYKKETDPKFANWRKEKEEAARKSEEARRRAIAEAEQKRIATELEHKKKEEAIRRKKEEELRPYEEDILDRKKLPCQVRVKVAKETYREDVMLRCAHDSAKSVFNALKQNPNLTPNIRSLIALKESITIISPVNNSSAPNVSSNSTKDDGYGCFWWFVVFSFIVGIAWCLLHF